MSADVLLTRLDHAAAFAGIDLLPLDGGRMAIFGPGPGTVGYLLVAVPHPHDPTLLLRIRSMVGYAPTAGPALDALTTGWNGHDGVMRWRSRSVGPALVLEGETCCRAVDELSDEELGSLVDVVADRARRVLDTCPLDADPAAAVVAGASRLLARAAGQDAEVDRPPSDDPPSPDADRHPRPEGPLVDGAYRGANRTWRPRLARRAGRGVGRAWSGPSRRRGPRR